MKKIFFLLLLLVLSRTPASALERFDIITTRELYDLLDQRKAGEIDFLLVNTLDKLLADHQTIPGSINIPWSEVSQSAKDLGSDREKLIITYCMGYR